MYSISFDFVFYFKMSHNIYHMSSRVTYQNISPEVTRKPWRFMSPFGIASAFVSPRGWYSGTSPSKPCDICIMLYGAKYNKNNVLYKNVTIIKRRTTRLGAKHMKTFCNPSPEMGTSLYNIFEQETIYRNSIIRYSYESTHQNRWQLCIWNVRL